jgi:AcrR family transcriptional regulator
MRTMFESARSSQGVSTRERPGDLTRRRILAVAREMFARQGYGRTSMRQLAARLAITDSALYYYFDHKRDIFRELMLEPEGVQPAFQAGTRSDLLDQLAGSFYAYAAEGEMVRIMLREQLCGGEESLEFRKQMNESWCGMYGPPLTRLYGDRALLILNALLLTLCGLLWDAALSYGDTLQEVARQPAFRSRVRDLLDLALPEEPLQ